MAALVTWVMSTGVDAADFSQILFWPAELKIDPSKLDFDMDMSDEILITDIIDQLNHKVAFITGGKTQEGYPIINMPECPKFNLVRDEEFVRLMTYLVRIPSRLEFDRGFVIIIDRSTTSWGDVKTTLIRIADYYQGYFPGIIQGVYVIKPRGFLQKTFSEMRFKGLKDEFKFKIDLVDSTSELHARIDPSQLTGEFGGTLNFDLKGWIEDRMAIERFASNCRERSTTVRALTEELQLMEMPNNAENATMLLIEQRKRRMEVKEDLVSAVKYGQTLLSCLRKTTGDGKEKNPDKLLTTCAIEKLLEELEVLEKEFDDTWSDQEARLIFCLKVRKYEEEFKVVLLLIENITEKINSESSIGNAIEECNTFLERHSELEEESKEAFDRSEQLTLTGEELMKNEKFPMEAASIGPKCTELDSRTSNLQENLVNRRTMLERSLELHQRIQKADDWCSDGMKLLASQEMDQSQSKEGAEKYLRQIDEELTRFRELKLSDPREFRQMFADILTIEGKFEQHKNLVRDAVTKMEDVRSLFEKRREGLKNIIAKFERPVVKMAPVAPLQQSPQSSTSSTPHSSPSAGKLGVPQNGNSAPLSPRQKHKKGKGQKLDRKIEIIRDDSQPLSFSSDGEFQDDVDCNSLSYKRRILMKMGVCPKSYAHQDNGFHHFVMEKNNSNSFRSLAQYKLRHVVKELIETEKIYVKELEAVLTGYIRKMDNPGLSEHIPPSLRGNADVLFANWEQLYNFHKSKFLVELENYRNTPTLVGKCFVDMKDELDHLYSVYCQNKPRSELFRRECGTNNTFFQECQKLLGHKLPLSAYLLKPVQRITKYQLLLKEMMRYSPMEKGADDLQSALDCMLTVLKYVNDSMHQVAITGYDGTLSDLGKLLMQGPLHMWTEHKSRHNLKDIRQKRMQRHIFLYERAVLFCKRRGDIRDKTFYAFKNSISTPSLGLTEHVKGDKKKFELWLGGRVEVFILQAPTESDKIAWTKAIRQALLVTKEPTGRKTAQKPIIENHVEVLQANTNAGNNNGLSLPSPTSDSSSAGSANPSLTSEPSLENDEEYDDWGSAEFTDSEDEILDRDCLSEPVDMNQYVVLAEYNVVEPGELAVQEGEIVDVQKVGKAGWWLVRKHTSNEQGWVPASYLEMLASRISRSNHSLSSQESPDER
ncbi:guanine nucleotide exchange factor DBS-like isoform X5 [Lytechinus variegatus]|uniref:guanine nucleotide exchange factor DBS-like isoform X5 n=1 Tax=Lytechinus variegatus TaxID=7654 RepID=UPI001BB13E5B|nr:guanine nucleotide exchange factor DBS-like isoform X5 [Lytechinus variegatus]